MFSRFFIDRPIFAAVISLFLVLAGLAAMRSLPIAQYPEIAPPVVTVQAIYPGASAEHETIAYVHFGDMVNVTLAEGQVCKFTRATANGYEAMVGRLGERGLCSFQ